MSSIPVLPGVGTAPANIAVVGLPDGSAAPAHTIITSAGTPASPMTEASAEAFAAMVAAFVAPLTPRAIPAQQGPLLFGYPL